MEGKIQFKSKLSDEWAVCNRKDEEVEGGRTFFNLIFN